MKHFIFLSLLIISILPVKGEDKVPYLVKTKDFKVIHFSISQIELGLTAVIFNPYKASIKIDEILIDVFINDKKLGTILEADDVVKMKKESAFDLPLKINVKTGPTLSSFMMEFAKLIGGQKIRVDYRGYIKVRAIGFIPVKVKINQFAYFTLNDIIGNSDPKPTAPKDSIKTK